MSLRLDLSCFDSNSHQNIVEEFHDSAIAGGWQVGEDDDAWITSPISEHSVDWSFMSSEASKSWQLKSSSAIELDLLKRSQYFWVDSLSTWYTFPKAKINPIENYDVTSMYHWSKLHNTWHCFFTSFNHQETTYNNSFQQWVWDPLHCSWNEVMAVSSNQSPSEIISWSDSMQSWLFHSTTSVVADACDEEGLLRPNLDRDASIN
ncbi:MAG: hypothetical protein ACPGUD_10480 [Parashewanella sp.]